MDLSYRPFLIYSWANGYRTVQYDVFLFKKVWCFVKTVFVAFTSNSQPIRGSKPAKESESLSHLLLGISDCTKHQFTRMQMSTSGLLICN